MKRKRTCSGMETTYPSVDLALVLTHNLLDVVGHDLLERGLVLDGRNPGRQLRVPDGGVTADELAILRRKVDELVGTAEGELALRALGGIPLHAVHFVSFIPLYSSSVSWKGRVLTSSRASAGQSCP